MHVGQLLLSLFNGLIRITRLHFASPR